MTKETSLPEEINIKNLIKPIKSIYDISLNSADGTENFMEQFKGKATLVINTTVGCGNANQLQVMQLLQSEFGGEEFQIIAIPTNDYCGPGITRGKWSQGITCGTDSKNYGEDVYGTTFQYSEMISSVPSKEVISQVSTHPGKNGVGQDLGEPHELYLQITNQVRALYEKHKDEEGLNYVAETDEYYSWWLNQRDTGVEMCGNYEKYFFDKEGYLVKHLPTNTLSFDYEATVKESLIANNALPARYSYMYRSPKIFNEEFEYTRNLIKELILGLRSEINPVVSKQLVNS